MHCVRKSDELSSGLADAIEQDNDTSTVQQYSTGTGQHWYQVLLRGSIIVLHLGRSK